MGRNMQPPLPMVRSTDEGQLEINCAVRKKCTWWDPNPFPIGVGYGHGVHPCTLTVWRSSVALGLHKQSRLEGSEQSQAGGRGWLLLCLRCLPCHTVRNMQHPLQNRNALLQGIHLTLGNLWMG